MMDQTPILDRINCIEDYYALEDKDLPALAEELRTFMIENVSKTGGHLASSLGAVELILAMHRVFRDPKDKIIFDVGHQAYAHKILTGRKDIFHTLRQENGISGFPKREESAYDAFNTGHATTSISAAVGMARAKKISGEAGHVIALIGDGALTGGMAFEAMNDAGQSKLPLIVILNDNDMSIAQNVGAIHRALDRIRMSRGYVETKHSVSRILEKHGKVGYWLSKCIVNFKSRIKNFLLPHQMFDAMGFTYLGPVNGHDLGDLIHIMNCSGAMKCPILVHVVTQKGKGYHFSEDDPERFHGISPFSVDTGAVDNCVRKSNSEVFGDTMIRIAAADNRVAAITAAMPLGTGLNGFSACFPERFFDVGIAEEHAVTMAAGMACCGMRPVVAIYSTFLQRAYDQILHDVCLQNLPVVFAVDRAGLVGDDGETHQGIYDIAYLSAVPNMALYSPATQQELVHMLHMAVKRGEPAAIRYPRGHLMQAVSANHVTFGKWEELLPIADCTVVATGVMVAEAMPIAKELGAGLVNARFLNPMDDEMLHVLAQKTKHVITVEDGVVSFGKSVALRLHEQTVTCLGIPNRPIPQATIVRQRILCGISPEDIRNAILEEV